MEKNNKTLNVPHLRFPEFSGEWKSIPISTIADIIGGGTPDTSVDEYWGGNIQWFTPSEIGKEKYAYLSDRTITEAGLKNSSAKLLPQGTVLLSTRATIGECSIATAECTTNQGFQSLVAKENNVSSEFLYYIVAKIKREMLRRSCGSTFLEISANELKKIHANIPSKAEQEKLVSLLSLIDQRIETQKKIIEKYESLIRGISNKLLYADNGIPVRLGDILLERSERTKVNNQHEVLSSTVKGIFSQREYFSKEIASENNIGYKIIHLHDVVLSPQNLWMGNINYNDKYDIGIVSPSYKIFSIAEGYDKLFVSALLKTHRALYNYMLVSEQGASVVRRNLNMEAFEQLVFKIPPYTTQCEIGRILDSMQKSLGIAISTQSHLEQQKQWLLRNLFI